MFLVAAGFQNLAVELAENESSAEVAEGVGEPVAGIVAGAVFEEGLWTS